MNAPYQKISPLSAKTTLSQKGILLDVRSEQEYNEGHLPNSISLPLDRVLEDCDRALPNKNLPIIVYCTGGTRSRIACLFLLDLGYTQIYDFGKMSNWGPY